MASNDHHNHRHHVVLFPFMSKGHTIPVLHLARLLVRRNATVTLFTTPANQSFISDYLSDLTTTRTFSILSLPFPENIGDGVPPGTESTDKLPEISLWVPFARSTHLMKPHFEQSLESLPGPPVTFMVTDGFLPWTLDSANKYRGGIPRLVYYGMGNFANAVSRDVSEGGYIHRFDSDDELFPVPHFPWVKVTRNDFDQPFTDRKPSGLHFEFIMDCVVSAVNSFGQIVNSFYELEPAYADFDPRTWSVGPLCLIEHPRGGESGRKTPPWMEWLDGMLEKGKPVLYVAFGSQAEISREQFREIKTGLEKSEANFLWVVRKNETELDDGFEVGSRGIVVREWVDQREILGHQSVQGFLSHCGWNSVLESICARVPILAWPMMAEQPLNARFVAEEIKVGIRVQTSNGSVRGFVTAEGLEKSVKELMEGETGKEARKKVKEFGDAAMEAVQEGGSSWKALDDLLTLLHGSETHSR
ncbi:OLC1v1011201C1 [Oldenlandia corymbosa var. corymbosa]|uniref:Glycosyltransferase n=1 Tax=Oldenlandia corymbosa var. corymbosa TaxID=529605 RepID=A0AAV1DT61_OLDCO|nr:OLC1v1011201C1 [Oldenlandia corymbosa var. corymbosa]